MRFSRAFQAALVSALFAAGCSGGNGGGGNGGDPPIADAGDDAAARIYQTYTLNGTQSTDPEGKDLTFAWSILSAPDGSAVTLTSSGAVAMPAFTPDAEGVYLFGLVVDDGKKSSALDTVEITVELRIAVFADRFGELAGDLEQSGVGQADDFVGYPDSYVIGGAGSVLVFVDFRNRETTLLAYRTDNASVEFLAAGEILDARAAGDFVVWTEFRNGRPDLFARSLLTGAEQQITNDDELEEIGMMAGNVLTLRKENPPYGLDVYVYGLESDGLNLISDMDVGIDESNAASDGATVVYTSLDTTDDVWGYDIDGQSTFAIAVNTTDDEFALGVSGDFVILQVSTGGAPSLYHQRISNSQRVPIAGPGFQFYEVDGDYVILDDGANLEAYRLSTGTRSVLSSTWNVVDLSNGVVAWTEFNGATSSLDVRSKLLPAGATANVTATTVDEGAVAVLTNGIAWDGPDAAEIYQAYYSGDGGTTTESAGDDKVYLTDVLDAYDVAVVGGEADSTFAADVIDALTAAGMPVLSLDRDGNSVADYYESEALYSLTVSSVGCGPAAITLSGAAHPAFAGFPPAGYVELERSLPVPYTASAFDVGITPPDGWQVLASYSLGSSCPITDLTALSTFTTADGTAVILDGAASDSIALWAPARRELLLSELRYLASTRAP